MKIKEAWGNPGVVVVACYAVLWWALPTLPFLDLPNHTARAFIISKIFFEPSSYLASQFLFEPSFTPYIFGDIGFATLLHYLPFPTATRLWVVVIFLLLPIAFDRYRHEVILDTKRTDGDDYTIWSTILACFLATNWFFLSGFFAFQLGAACTFFTLAFWMSFARKRNDLSFEIGRVILFFLFSLGTVLSYLSHLAAFVFLAIFIGVSLQVRLIQRRISFVTYCFSAFPILLLAMFHLFSRLHTGTEIDLHWEYREPIRKLLALTALQVRFNVSVDAILLVIFFGTLVLATIPGIRKGFWRHSHQTLQALVEHAAIIIALLLSFLILPAGAMNVSSIDDRALLFVYFELLLIPLLFRVNLSEGNTVTEAPVSVAAIMLTVLNIGYLAAYLFPAEQFLENYQRGLAAIPERQRVLPIATTPDQGRLNTAFHASAAITPLRDGITPYLFSGSRNDVMTYFQYRTLSPAPNPFWYIRHFDVNWVEYLPHYDFVVVTKPFEKSRMPENLEPFFENPNVAVFRIRDSRTQSITAQ